MEHQRTLTTALEDDEEITWGKESDEYSLFIATVSVCSSLCYSLSEVCRKLVDHQFLTLQPFSFQPLSSFLLLSPLPQLSPPLPLTTGMNLLEFSISPAYCSEILLQKVKDP